MNARASAIRNLKLWWAAAPFMCGLVAVVLIPPLRILAAAVLISPPTGILFFASSVTAVLTPARLLKVPAWPSPAFLLPLLQLIDAL
ncbi:hypothetical protein [Rhodococcus opacus]|uniref:hypothetical protein n=1 Tax=Rhodococcus opacus TaxID=37919 RepID=UPI0024BBA5B9|nr:hypothetical protein [Rhodococcus opacus]MDJ0419831.1 hypothetical protein [Rhodococcus opacus]